MTYKLVDTLKAPFPNLSNCTIAIIGLGYVGLPLAVEFGKKVLCQRTGESLKRRVIGFDIDNQRLQELQNGFDRTNETKTEELKAATQLEFSSDACLLSEADVFIVTVPTPIDSAKKPDLTPLQKASSTIGKALKTRAAKASEDVLYSLPIVIYESTVYPGATEEICVPILESVSGLIFNRDFACGYSPERINPGDNEHKLSSITKVTSGSSSEAAHWVDQFYGSIITAGTHLAPTIKVAEAAKVIENTQRDLNIALVNELAIIFKKMEVDTLDVLEAAGTKWNFLPFRPGLVGGHCISVDPYYLTHKAEQLGYLPQVVLAGRRINDGMGNWIVQQLVVALSRKKVVIGGAKVLVLGLSFKENCPDLRNTRVVDVINSLCNFGMEPLIVDPCVNANEALQEYNLKVIDKLPKGLTFTAVILAVSHNQFCLMSTNEWEKLLDPEGIILDLKGIAPRELGPIRL